MNSNTLACTDDLPALGRNGHPKKRAFLAAYAQLGCVSRAAEAAGCSRNSHYNWLENDRDYRAAFAQAEQIAGDVLEAEALRRAVHGIQEPVIHHGRQCFRYVDENGNDVPADQSDARKIPLTVTRYSDTMLIFLMKGRMPHKYGDRKRLEHSGRVDHEPVDMHITYDFTDAEAIKLAGLLSRISYTMPVPDAG